MNVANIEKKINEIIAELEKEVMEIVMDETIDKQYTNTHMKPLASTKRYCSMPLTASKWSISSTVKIWRNLIMNNLMLITIFFVTLVLFFWGVWKAVKTQKTVYMLAMVPFFMLMVGIFFI